MCIFAPLNTLYGIVVLIYQLYSKISFNVQEFSANLHAYYLRCLHSYMQLIYRNTFTIISFFHVNGLI